MNLRSWLSAAALFGAVTTSALSQEWTRFRGPNGSGMGELQLPTKFTEKDINWKVDLPGTGHSSPVLWGDKIFLTCADSASAKRLVLCINDKDGSVRWKREIQTPAYRMHAENNYASSSPAVDAERVYLLYSTPEEYSLRALTHDGKDVWQVNFGPYVSQHGSGTSPMLYKDLCIVTKDEEGNNAFIVAVNKKNGQEVWRIKRNKTKMAASTPCILTVDGQDQLIVTSMYDPKAPLEEGGAGIAALDPMTGKVLWMVPEAQPERPVCSVALCDDVIIGPCGEGGFGRYMYTVRAGSKDRKPEILYRKVQAQSPPYVPTPYVVGDLVFLWGDQGVVTCLKAKTGEQVWQERVASAKPGFFTSIVGTKDRFFGISKTGEVYCVRASDKFELLNKLDLGVNEQCSATPAIANGKLYIRTFSHLFSLGGAKQVATLTPDLNPEP